MGLSYLANIIRIELLTLLIANGITISFVALVYVTLFGEDRKSNVRARKGCGGW